MYKFVLLLCYKTNRTSKLFELFKFKDNIIKYDYIYIYQK